MEFGYDVIADLLAERFGAEAPIQDAEREFGLPDLVRTASDPADRNLLVVAASQRDRVAYKRNKLLVLAGEDWPPHSEHGMRSPCILVRNASPETVFAEIIGLYARAIEWETHIAEALEFHAPLQTILDTAAHALGNPVIFYDDKLEEYTYSISAADEALVSQHNPFHEMIKARTIPLELFNNEKLQEYLAHSEPFLTSNVYPGTQGASVMLNAPVHEGGIHGIVGMRVLHGEIRRIHYWHIERLAHAIERHYRNAVAWASSGRIDIHSSLRGLIDGSADRHEALQLAESYIGDDKLLVCSVARFVDEGSRNMPLSYLCEKAEQALEGRAVVFEMNGGIAALAWSKSADSAFTATEQLASLLGSYGAAIGCSNAFDSAIALPAHVTQANRALDLSDAERGTAHRFSDVAVDYLLRYGTTELEPRYLVAPGFAALLAYNNASAVDYIDTLRRFFTLGGNVSALARACGVNRSTLLFRLGQIENITKMSLNDSSDRLFLELSLRLYDNRNNDYYNL